MIAPSESIDYAVMEKTEDGVVIPMDCDWNDVGAGLCFGRSLAKMTTEM